MSFLWISTVTQTELKWCRIRPSDNQLMRFELPNMSFEIFEDELDHFHFVSCDTEGNSLWRLWHAVYQGVHMADTTALTLACTFLDATLIIHGSKIIKLIFVRA